MSSRTDALVIGAGPAGAAAAILLARAGWSVVLVEQDDYPRRKVCGECVSAGALTLLDELGIGAGVRNHAGPELRKLSWMGESTTVMADFPPCAKGPYRFGRVLRRDFLDGLLVERAVAQGVIVLQPARVRAVRGEPGAFQCDIDSERGSRREALDAAVVIDAHGSWQRGPETGRGGHPPKIHRQPRPADLLAFKAVFQDTRLEPGVLPVIALAGGYGGMAVADNGLMTLACCLRRDALSACRPHGTSAGEAVQTFLQHRCIGVRQALEGARRVGPWLAVGPLQTGMRRPDSDGLFRVGNAAGESHPLIGEGIAMALQSATLLVAALAGQRPAAFSPHCARNVQRSYAAAWRHQCRQRLTVSALFAHIAMRPALAAPAQAALQRWPALLTMAARLAGKAREFAPAAPYGASRHEHA